jgi:hypothetical protein
MKASVLLGLFVGRYNVALSLRINAVFYSVIPFLVDHLAG